MLIYKIENNYNDKMYIGQTTRTLEARIKDYKDEMKWKSSFNSKKIRPIIRAMLKYGFESFVFSILKDNISTKSDLDYYEKKYIHDYNTVKNGYNVEYGGNSVGKHSEETRMKIRNAQLGSKNHMYGKTGNLNKTSKAVIDITTGKIYGSAMQAAKELNLEFSHVCSVARSERASTKGHVFRYIFGEFDLIFYPSNHIKFRKSNTYSNVLPQYYSFL
jgi:group I intron endonuclease